MKKIGIIFIAALLLLPACNGSSQTTTTEPTPVPEPGPSATEPSPQPSPAPETDIPEQSEEEMTAFIWNKLPHYLPDNYTKTQFSSPTGEATYCGEKKWSYTVYGTETKSSLLTPTQYEKSPGNWVKNISQEVSTCEYVLTADYYENTGTLDILDIQINDIQTTTETVSEQSIIGEGLRVKRITGTSGGSDLRLEGSVVNIGITPLENVIIEVKTYAMNGDLLRTDTATLTPSLIDVGETGSFFLHVMLESTLKGAEESEGGSWTLGKYNYKFLLPSGEELYFEVPE